MFRSSIFRQFKILSASSTTTRGARKSRIFTIKYRTPTCLTKGIESISGAESSASNMAVNQVLTARIAELERELAQLKGQLVKESSTEGNDSLINMNSRWVKKKVPRQLDWSKFTRRRIALKFLYLGWNYDGLVEQSDERMKTVESVLFEALIRTRLIESRETCNFQRCGRTDKGVSSFGQVCSLNVRSNLTMEGASQLTNMKIGLYEPEGYYDDRDRHGKSWNTEIEYVRILNRVLPKEIRVLAWAPVNLDFSARFHCTSRSYKYMFPQADLNIDLMRQAAQYLVGCHDFRNFCKMDVKNGVEDYVRTIHQVDIDVPDLTTLSSGYAMCTFSIVGRAFLHNQIRCIITLLLLVGKSLEKPSIIKDLLDLTSYPARPGFRIAESFPLVLLDCEYPNSEMPTSWIYCEQELTNVLSELQSSWTEHSTKTNLVQLMISGIEEQLKTKFQTSNLPLHQAQCLSIDLKRDKNYTPLSKRPLSDSLDEKIAKKQSKKCEVSNGETSESDLSLMQLS